MTDKTTDAGCNTPATGAVGSLVDQGVRPAFELWFSNGGKWPVAVQRNGDGYALGAAQVAWIAWQAAVAAERERCAKLCDLHGRLTWNDDRQTQSRVLAAEIRRGPNEQ